MDQPMKKSVMFTVILAIGLVPVLSSAADQGALSETQLNKEVEQIKAEDGDAARLNKTRQLAKGHRFSSMQVKTIAMQFADDDARLEFALSAFPQVVDPENFYEVYDAFSRFSKVMRLHDRIRPAPIPPVAPPVHTGPVPMSDQDLKTLVVALKNEPFENGRLQLAKQAISSSRGNFLSAQVKQLIGCFAFEPGKLDLAKFAYDYTLDREMYFVVYEAFSFSSTRDELARYIQGRTRGPGLGFRKN